LKVVKICDTVGSTRVTVRMSTAGVNFINVLCTAFTLVDPKSVKKIGNLTVFFMLLGSARVKAVHRMLVKLTPAFESRQD